MSDKRVQRVPMPTIQRLPMYLNYLNTQASRGRVNVSSANIASALGLTGIQVRKDLAWISNSGKPRTGFPVELLIQDIRAFLGYELNKRAILVGVGHLGRAFLEYDGFGEYGIEIVGAYDIDDEIIGEVLNGVEVEAFDNFPHSVETKYAELLILTVPSSSAQGVVDVAVSCGVKYIWSFVPQIVHVPEDVTVQLVDMAQSLAVLWRQMIGE
ncbi:MAG: redox-sensing transcriptional repressor Rex [Eubacteriales bacterium]|nr:redox-sensing transcriptional repressor Rex [Eubacteriales bacterium]